MNLVKLGDIDKRSAGVGQKAMYLGELLRLGFPVPGGFVVTQEAFEKFLVFNRADEKIRDFFSSVDWESASDVAVRSKAVRDAIAGGQFPSMIEKDIMDEYGELSFGREAMDLSGAALGIVRAGRNPAFCGARTSVVSNSGYSFAGQTDSIMNVVGGRMLLDSIKACWASLFSTSCLAYSRKAGSAEAPAAGVIIQRMVNSEKSAAALCPHPYSDGSVLVESAWGLGEAMGLGEVMPDIYSLDINSGTVTDRKIGRKAIQRKRHGMSGMTVTEAVLYDRIEQEVLSAEELSRIFEYSRKAAASLGSSLYLEFGIEKGKVFVLQAREVYNKKPDMAPFNGHGSTIFSGVPASYGVSEGPVIMGRQATENTGNGILVVKENRPDFANLIGRISGIISEYGGVASHASSIAREFLIPSIVCAKNASSALKDGQEIVLDAINGRVVSKVTESSIAGHAAAYNSMTDRMTATEIRVSMPCESTDNYDGIGLVRGEGLVTDSVQDPYSLAENGPEELTILIKQKLGEAAKMAYPLPVCYRMIDIPYCAEGEKLPLRGIRRSLEQPGIIQCEVEAVRRLHQEGLNNIRIMVPFVAGPADIKELKKYVDFGAEIGISVESPAAVLMIEEMCSEGISFASIDPACLSGFILGTGSDDAGLVRSAEKDPSVLKAMGNVIKACRKHRVYVSLHGEAANDPEMAGLAVEMGVNSISVSHASAEAVRNAVARAERRIIMDMLRSRKRDK